MSNFEPRFIFFQGERCARLLRSDLPSLQGNLVLSNSLALRLIIRMSSMRQTLPKDKGAYKRAEHACARLVNCPLFNPFDPSGESDSKLMTAQMAHCFRFSVEYLLRVHLLRVSSDGTAVKAPEKALATENMKLSSNDQQVLDSWMDYDSEKGPKSPVATKQLEIGDSDGEAPLQPEQALDATLESQPYGRKGNSRCGQLEPNDLAAFVAHLFFMEPSNFAFLSLLTANEGSAMRHLCRPDPERDVRVLSVLCNIFCRTRLPRPVADRARAYPATTGPSKVLLPGLDEIGENVPGADGQSIREGHLLKDILRQHNEDAVRALVGYWTCFVEAYADQLGKDDALPISGFRFLTRKNLNICSCSKLVRCIVDHCNVTTEILYRFPSKSLGHPDANLQQSTGADADLSATQEPRLPPVEEKSAQGTLHSKATSSAVPLLGEAFEGIALEPVVRSAFVGLSGHGDDFGSIHELCSTARKGVYLDPKMVPVFDIPANDNDEPLNAYILDFYKHKQVV